MLTGEGISAHGYRTDSGAYGVMADGNNTAAIAFDAARGGAAARALRYLQPAVIVSRFDVADDRLRVELSQNNGVTFEDLPKSWYNVTTRQESAELGGSDRRLLQLLCPIPAAATGPHAWVLRIRESAR